MKVQLVNGQLEINAMLINHGHVKRVSRKPHDHQHHSHFNTQQTTIGSTLQQYEKQQPEKVQEIYTKTKQLIENFDQSIVNCKKYNQIRTFKKYEILIRELEAENAKLKEKVEYYQQMTNPNKQYFENLLNKLISFKSQNQRLQLQLSKSNQTLETKVCELERDRKAIRTLQNNIKSKIKLPTLQLNQKRKNLHESQIAVSIRKFLQEKSKVNLLYSFKASKFEIFLKNRWPEVWQWNTFNLLEQIDKWIENLKEPISPDMWKARYSAVKRMKTQNSQQKSTISIEKDYETQKKTVTAENSLIQNPGRAWKIKKMH